MAFVVKKMTLDFMKGALLYGELASIGNDHLHVGL
jgi:hypothetical protein